MTKTQPAGYKLVWREFRRTLVHEMVMTFCADGPGPLALLILNPPNVGPPGIIYPSGYSYHFDPDRNLRFTHGFPLPRGGGLVLEWTGFEKIPVHQVFMDDVFLCGECGRIHEDGAPDSHPDWLFAAKGSIDTAAMFAEIDRRRDKKEFEIRQCTYRECCVGTVERFRKDFNREAELERLEQQRREWVAREESERKASDARNEEMLRKLLAAPPQAVVEPEREQAVYLVGVAGHSGVVKIGIASHVKKRVRSLQTSCPFPIKLLKSWMCTDARSLEELLHSKYAKYRQSGEWFHLPDDELTTLLSVEALDDFVEWSVDDTAPSGAVSL